MCGRVGLILWALTPGIVQAHAASTSFIELRVDAAQLSGRWDIALRDLEEAIGLDANSDGALSWGEIRSAEARILAYAGPRLRIEDGERPCPLQLQTLRIAEHLDGRYAALQMQAVCASAPQNLRLHYDLFFDIDDLHRGLLRLEQGGKVSSAVFSPERRQLVQTDTSALSVFRRYLHEGIWHVWTGWDHLLFLAALFLPAATRKTRQGWQVASTLRAPLWESARVVTAFTLAHAATLSLAALGWVQWPTQWVESAVAATVIFAALNNLLPLVAARWLPSLAIVFGLIHGSAIAGALLELGLPTQGRLWALLAFNLGVECAQLALVIVVVPLGYVLRHLALYRRAVLLPGSILVMLIGLTWLLQRLFGVDLVNAISALS